MLLTDSRESGSSRMKWLEALVVGKRLIPHIQTTKPLESLELEANKVVKVGVSLGEEAKQALFQFYGY